MFGVLRSDARHLSYLPYKLRHPELARWQEVGRQAGYSPVIAKLPQRMAGIFPFPADPACNHCIPDRQTGTFAA